MRFRNSIVTFLITFAIGVSTARRESITEWLWPSFSREEAVSKVGRRFRNRRVKDFRLMKCPDEGICKETADGEIGTIVGVEKVPNGGYFLTVLWGETRHEGKALVTYLGRYAYRKSVIEQ